MVVLSKHELVFAALAELGNVSQRAVLPESLPNISGPNFAIMAKAAMHA